MITFPAKLQAACLRLVKTHPYLAAATWALIPVESTGLGSLAVDEWWRVYYDPAIIERWGVEELAGVVYHEIAHLLRNHADRMRGFDPRLSNVAADAEINDDLIAEKVVLPDDPVTPSLLGQPDGLLAEEYYNALVRAQESAPQRSSGGTSGSKVGDSVRRGPGDGGDGNGGSNAAGGQNPLSSSGSPADSSTQPEASSKSSRPSDRGVGGAGDVEAQTPAPGAGRCGSCATGHSEPWELGAPCAEKATGISRAEGELIRRDVARHIQEATRARGSIPGHWTRWAEEKLRPKVDWRRELAAAVRHAITDVAGASDYSYRRPSRRQGQVGNGKVVLPSLRQPVPSVAVVVDTSGSIDDTMLSRALAEVSGVLKAVGQREGVHVLAVDAVVQSCRRVFRPEQVQLAGGGGTNMGAGLEAAARLRPSPQVVIVITDGYTPWPASPPRGMKVIVVLTGRGSAPGWAKKVVVE